MTRYIPKDQRDPRYYIFNVMFDVRIQNLHLRTEEEVRLFGTPTVGNKAYDRQAAMEFTHVRRSIAQMAELFKENVPIKVIDPAQTKTIYEHISTYLNAWKVEMEVGMNFNKVPRDDLLLLDRFAQEIYPHACWHFKVDTFDSILARRLGSINSFTPSSLLKTNKPVVAEADVPAEERFPVRKRFDKVFANGGLTRLGNMSEMGD